MAGLAFEAHLVCLDHLSESVTSLLVGVLVSQWCYHTHGLTQIYSLPVLEVKDLKWVSFG